ncbi:tetratricopeptide repeat protein [bacterium]|nr:tetratricopeptide repeat protein [bacterium]
MKKHILLAFLLVIIAFTGCTKLNDWQKGMNYYDRGKYKKAIKYFLKEAEKVESRRDQCYYQIGKSYYKLGKYEDAKKYFAYIAKPKDSKEIIQIYMEALWQFNGAKFNLAYDAFDKIIVNTPTYKDGKAYYYFLRTIYHVKGLETAIDETNYALTVLKDHLSEKGIGNIYNLYAKFLVEGKRYKDAIDYLKKSLVLDDDFYTHYNLGIAYENLKDYKDAKMHFFQSYILGHFDEGKWKYFKYCDLNEIKKNIDMFGFNAKAFKYFTKGVDYFNKGSFEYFRYWVQKALDIDPKTERIFYQWGTYQLLFKKDALYKANILHYVLGKGDIARKDYEQLKSSYDRDLNYAIVLLKSGRLAESEKLLKGLKKGKYDDRKYFYLGLLYLNEGKINNTLDSFRSGLKINKDLVSLTYFQGILNEMKKKKFADQDKLLEFLKKDGNKEVITWIKKNLDH